MPASADTQPVFFMEDEDDLSQDEASSPASQRTVAATDLPNPALTQTRTLIASLFSPYTIVVDASLPSSSDTLQRRRSVGATEFKRQRRQSDSRGLRPDPLWWHVEPSNLGNIGLQNAVKASVGRIGKPIWFGMLGVSTKEWSDTTKSNVDRKMLEEYGCVPVFVTDEELEGHYNQFCKQVLWKPFHYQLPDYPSGQAYDKKAWDMYLAVNRKFAEAIARQYQPGDAVWINDYHLMLVPALLRELVPNATIGFFLHIPFPSSEIFRCLHVRKDILRGMLGADMIGFQTYSFMRHFLMTCTRLLAVESTPRGVQLEDRLVAVMPIPIGIHLEALDEKRRNPEVAEIVASLREKYAGMKVLVGRDKNDYVKGVRQKMLAYERFLKEHPEWQGKVVLIQVALSTTEANESETRVSDVVARINSRFGTIEYSPVIYLYQDISYSHYLAILSVADACLITSLRDGMNLTSHEYVVCQEANRGPLIISEFAGTYGSFGAALRINPWDVPEVADTIHEAITMTEEEKAYRWNELYSHIIGNTAQAYVETFVTELIKAHEDMERTLSTTIPPLPSNMVVSEYIQSRKRLFLLDHDGTLTNFNKHSSTKLLSTRIPESHVIRILQQLTTNPKNIVYIMSGRLKSELAPFENMPNVGICAENGCFLKYANRSTWETLLPDLDLSWRERVLEIFEYYQDRTPGSYIEQKEIGMVWHYGYADMAFGSWQAAECQNHIEQALSSSYAIHTLAKKRSIEVLPRNVNKGVVVRRVLDYHQGRFAKNKSGRHTKRSYSVASVISASGTDGLGISAPETRMLTKHRSLTSGLDGYTEGASEAIPPGIPAASTIPSSEPTRERVDFIFSVGDDRADEYMFEYLRRLELHQHRHDTGSQSTYDTTAGSPSTELLGLSMSVMSLGEDESEYPHTPTPDEDHFADGVTSPTSTSSSISGTPLSVSDEYFSLRPRSFPLTSNAASTTPMISSLLQRPLHTTPPASSTIHHPITTRRRRIIITATVGKKCSAAKWSVSGPNEVLALLELLNEADCRKGGLGTRPEAS
ncbi:glycosyltransferase family 20-domain-containing protein [Gaertneriomyces semiglobifer]|nr:glycosyltransferase family 20-domain-containing protein [Gaertneriomyces semiglobifer]